MNKLRISIFTIAISLFTISCGESTKKANTTDDELTNDNTEINIKEHTIAKNVNGDEFKLLIQKGGLLIDVRTPEEVAEGSIDGNTNINVNSPNFKSEIQNLDKNVSVLVYCKSGSRSGKAMGMMKEMGFKEVYNLNGGYSGWSK